MIAGRSIAEPAVDAVTTRTVWRCGSERPSCPEPFRIIPNQLTPATIQPYTIDNFDSAWCLVCEVCRLKGDWVECRCFLSFVFLGGARRLELSPCDTIVRAQWLWLCEL